MRNLLNIFNQKSQTENFDYIKDSLTVQALLCERSDPYDLIFKTHHFFGSIDGKELKVLIG